MANRGPLKPNILLVTAWLPYPPTMGSGQRTTNIHRALSRVGHVELLILKPGAVTDEQLARQRQLGPTHWVAPARRGEHGLWRCIRPLHHGWTDRLAHNFGRRSVDYRPDRRALTWLRQRLSTTHYDLIVGRQVLVTCKSGAFEVDVPVIVDVDDLDTEVYRTRLAVPGLRWHERALVRNHLRQLQKIVPRQLKRALHLWIANELDHHLVDHPSVSVLPNVPFAWSEDQDAPTPAPAASESPVVLTIGSCTHRVNTDAIDRFVSHAWPKVRERCPDAVLRIVGSGMTQAMRQRWGSVAGVEPIGFVDDLALAYRDCSFTVAPQFEGGGSKIKVLESLLYGRACVVTGHALRGYERLLKHAESVWLAESERDLWQGCLQLLQDPKSCQAMASCGRKIVAEHYSFEVVRRAVATTFSEVLRAP